jgi:hypothetical protein
MEVVLATTFVLPDEEGPGARLEARSGSLRPHSTRRRCSRPLRLCPDPLAAFVLARLRTRTGDVGSGRHVRPWRPVSIRSPAKRIERRLVAHHGEREAVGSLTHRALDHPAGFAALFERRGVAGEVRMALTQRLAELQDRLS